MRHVPHASVVVLCLVAVLSGCKKKTVGEPEQLVALRAVMDGARVQTAKGPDGNPWPVVERIAEGDPAQAGISAALEGQFAREAFKVHQQARRYLGEQKGVPDETQDLLKGASAVVLGMPAHLPARGVMLKDGDSDPREVPHVLWVSIPASDANPDDGSLEQTLAGAIGQLTMAFILQPALARIPMEKRGSLGPHPWVMTDPTSAMIAGYGLHQETLARRYSRSGKLNTALNVEGTDPRTMRVAAITTNRYAYQPTPPSDYLKTDEERAAYLARWMAETPPLRGTLWRGAQMVGVPGVVASVFNQLAEDPSVALEAPKKEFFAPFFGGEVPEDFATRSLHASELSQLKMLHAAWVRLSARDGPEHPGINHLLDAFGGEFPTERAAAMKALMNATFARTATTQEATGVEGAALMTRTVQEVVGGSLYPDGAVGKTLMVRLTDVQLPPTPGAAPEPLVFNLNAAMPWQLEAVNGMLRDDAGKLHTRLVKTPIDKLSELAGTIPAEAYKTLERGME